MRETGLQMGDLDQLNELQIDADEKQLIEEKLRLTQQELRDVLRLQQGLTFKIRKENESFRYTWADGQLVRRLGFTPEEVTGKWLEDIYKGDYAAYLRSFYERAWNGEQVQYEAQYNGITYLVWLQPILQNGQVVEALGTSVEITKWKKMKEELHTIQELFELIFQQTVHAIAVIDLDGRVLKVNDEFVRMFGWTKEELIGKTFPTTSPEKHEQMMSYLDRIRAGIKTVIEFEDHKICKNGSLITVNVKLSGVRNSKGRMVAYSKIIRDITEEKRAESQLKNNERILAKAQKIANMGSWVWDASTKRSQWSEGKYRILGLSPEELKETTYQEFRKFVHPEDVERVDQAFRLMMENGEPLNQEYRIIRPDGTIRHVQAITEVEMSEGQIVQLIGVIQDLTERKIAEQQHRMVKEQLESFLRNSSDSIAFFDLELRLIDANQACENLFGWTKQEMQGQKILQQTIPPHIQSEFQELLGKVRQGEPVVGHETIRNRRNGELITISLSLSPILDPSGTIVGFSTVCRDITDRKRTEEALLQSEKLSVAGLLAAGIAHEIRNPLTALKGFTQLMQEMSADDKQKEYSSIMLNELGRIESIVNELLVLAKPQPTLSESTDLSALLSGVIALLESEARLNQVDFLTRFQSVPSITCSPNQLKQVFVNLIQNGIHAMPKGGSLEVCLEAKQDWIEIRIIDQGLGMSEEALGKLGQPFFTTKERGTGLGLMISQKIVQDHHGTIEFCSQVGVGTSVTVRLPIK